MYLDIDTSKAVDDTIDSTIPDITKAVDDDTVLGE